MRSSAASALADAIESAVETSVATSADPPPPIDPQADTLALARALTARLSHDVEKLPTNSPRLNPLHANMRALVKLIDGLERERASRETPDELERRLRREDAETRQKIEQHVLAYEAEATAKGVCLHCGQALLDGPPA